MSGSMAARRHNPARSGLRRQGACSRSYVPVRWLHGPRLRASPMSSEELPDGPGRLFPMPAAVPRLVPRRHVHRRRLPPLRVWRRRRERCRAGRRRGEGPAGCRRDPVTSCRRTAGARTGWPWGCRRRIATRPARSRPGEDRCSGQGRDDAPPERHGCYTCAMVNGARSADTSARCPATGAGRAGRFHKEPKTPDA